MARRGYCVPGRDCLLAVQHLCAGWSSRAAASSQLVGGETRGGRVKLRPCSACGWSGSGRRGRAGSSAWRGSCQCGAGGTQKSSTKTAQSGARG